MTIIIIRAAVQANNSNKQTAGSEVTASKKQTKAMEYYKMHQILVPWHQRKSSHERKYSCRLTSREPRYSDSWCRIAATIETAVSFGSCSSDRKASVSMLCWNTPHHMRAVKNNRNYKMMNSMYLKNGRVRALIFSIKLNIAFLKVVRIDLQRVQEKFEHVNAMSV